MDKPEKIDFEELLARMSERGRREPADRKQPQVPTKIIPLPIWPESFRGIPNGILRSALFGAVKRGKRAIQTNTIKPALKGIEIKYTGQQLDQADLDVWEYCLHVCRSKGLGVVIEFSNYQCLKGISRAQGGKNVEWLKSVLQRLSKATVSIEEGRFDFSGMLVQHYYYDVDNKKNVVVLNQRLIALYHAGWTQIEWEQREKLRGNPLAQWMHGFYCTHAAPFPLKITTIHKLSGSENQNLNSFKGGLVRALALLSSELGWTCVIEDGLVKVDKPMTASQARHIHNSGDAYRREP